MRGEQKNMNRYVVISVTDDVRGALGGETTPHTIDAHEAVVEPSGVLALYEHCGERLLKKAYAPGRWHRFHEMTQLRGKIEPRGTEE